jgi:hypothetical protein
MNCILTVQFLLPFISAIPIGPLLSQGRPHTQWAGAHGVLLLKRPGLFEADHPGMIVVRGC